MSSIPRFDSSATADELREALHAHGVLIVEALADRDLCDRIENELAPWIEATPYGADDFTGRTTRRTGALLTKAPASIEMVTHPLILDTVDQTLWSKKSSFQLHLTQSIEIGPDSPAQYVHRDHWCFDFFPFPIGTDVEVATIWALNDFTEANGATRVVPGSHRELPGRRYDGEPTLPATMPRGSVVLYLGSTLHGGGANTTQQPRVGINVDYVLGWLRQEENQYLSYSLDEVREFPERVQQLLGYQPGAYALGYIDGGRSPMTLLTGERPATQAFEVS